MEVIMIFCSIIIVLLKESRYRKQKFWEHLKDQQKTNNAKLTIFVGLYICLPISEDMTQHVSDKNGHKMFINIFQIYQ